MNDAPRAIRPHIVILGRCNVGKSTLINALCGQEIALVSTEAGTTTDPVYKSMELLPYGPVVFVDTAGLDDPSLLGQERVKLTERAIRKADLALLVLNRPELNPIEEQMVTNLRKKNIPTLLVVNVFDAKKPYNETTTGKIAPENICLEKKDTAHTSSAYIHVNAKLGTGIRPLRETMAVLLERTYDDLPLVRDLLKNDAPVILVTPIDSAAPKGRLILPQVQMLRDILDANCTALVCKETELAQALLQLQTKPQMVITDSQVFKLVAEIVPEDIPLTSFSILMARYKGNISELLLGVEAIDRLKPGDKVLIAEACTHHSQEDDIGRVKIPRLIQTKVGGPLDFTWVTGQDFAKNLQQYKLIIHCGACMINRKEMLARLHDAADAGIPMVNYGMLLAHLNGILERSLKVLRPEER